MLFAGIDIGTSSIKGILVNEYGEIVLKKVSNLL